jgi:sugar phosphate isomerase/epimerase
MKRITRRECLALGGTLAAASLAATKPRKVTVAAHAWVYAAPLPGYDFTPVLPQIFDDLKYAGVDAVELMERALRHADSVEKIGELSRKHELPVIGTSYEGPMYDRSKHSQVFDDASLVIERVAKLGGRTLGTSVGDAGRKKTENELDAQAELVRRLRTVAQKHGVVLNLHNHIYEVKDNEYDLRGTLARIPDAKLGPDLDWLTGAGENPADFIRRYSSRIVYMHIRDRKANGEWSEAVGEGVIDYAAVRKALDAIPYQGDVAIELAHPKGFQLTRPLRESWKMSREYVRRVLGY